MHGESGSNSVGIAESNVQRGSSTFN